MKLVSVSEMRAIEQEADANGLTYDQMMENAGYNLAHEIMEMASYKDDEDEIQVLGLVGPGNNGGDTLVALARLAEKGWTTRAYLVKRKSTNDPLITRLENAEGEIYNAIDDSGFHQLHAFLETADVVMDGVLGTGFELPLKEEIGNVLSAAKSALEGNEGSPLVVAVDCPSGVNCDTGEAASQVIAADATFTMAAVKQGLLKLPAFQLAGEIRVLGIGDLSKLKSWHALTNEVADDSLVSTFLPKRPADAHKGTFGTAFIAAGSLNYTGAALLAGKAAARIGVGLVTMAIPAPLHTALAGHFPEATWILLPHEMGVVSSAAADVLAKNMERASVLLFGPGLGLEETTREFIEKLLVGRQASKSTNRRIGFIQDEKKQGVAKEEKSLPPVVVDADGLKHLVKIKGWQSLLPAPAVLTPHPGEMALLTGLSLDDIQADRLMIVRKFAAQWAHVVVLKGAFTVIASPDGRTTTIPVATPALSHAGTGDVLAGLIAGLRAQGAEAYEAAVAGAWIHARAGEVASEIIGSSAAVLAGDILDCVAEVMREYEM